jgi:hypothetical protein
MVLDSVVGPALEFFCNFSPLISIFFVCLKNNFFLSFSPRVFIDGGIQVIVPSLATLFASSSLQAVHFHHFGGNDGPTFVAIFFDQLFDGSVFFLFPSSSITHNK